MFCYDKNFDEATKPQESAGPAAMAYSPLQVRRAKAKVGEYPINISLQFYRHVTEFNVALWDFRDVPNTEALAHMREITRDISSPEIPVLTENVPPRALTVDGKAAATLVVPENAAPQEIVAAQEIQEAVADMSRALLPIKSDAETVSGNRVFIGETRQARTAGFTMTPKSAGEAGFSFKTVGSDIYITAEHPVAAIYGACELLEGLGMRWFLPGP